MRKVIGWMAGAVGVLALLLSSVGTAAADEDETLPKPTINTQNNPPFGSGPNCVAVTWAAPNAPPDETIAGYSVERDNPKYEKDVGQLLQHTVCGQEPGTAANFKVCALWVSEEEDPVTSCSPPTSLSSTKSGVGEMEPQAPRGPLPVPPVKPILNPGTTEFGVEWGWKGTNADPYDYYNLTITPDGGNGRFMKHDEDGNWGWQLVTGLTPGTTYSVVVEGCDIDPIPYTNDNCSGWSAPAKVTTKSDLAYGPDTCKSGFVWRDGVPGDHICVTPDRRQKVADDLNTGRSRMAKPAVSNTIEICEPGSDPKRQVVTGMCEWQPPKCLEPYVPRDIPGENVLVCVDQKEADLIKQENANPGANRVQS